MGKQRPTSAASRTSATAEALNADNASIDATPSNAVDERYLVPALMRGVQALQVFSDKRDRLTLSELASAIGLTRSSAYRLVYTLDHLGFLSYDPASRTYALGSQVLRLGYDYLASRDLVAVAMPHLERLRDKTSWSAHLGELRETEVVYLARVPTLRSVASIVQVGTHLPAHATAMGRILLADLAPAALQARYRGVALKSFSANTVRTVQALATQAQDDAAAGFVVQASGYEPGVASVAAAVRDLDGKVVAAINISAIAQVVQEIDLHGVLKNEVVRAAAAISRDLGHRG